MKKGINKLFQVKNDNKNYPFLLKHKRLTEKKLRKNEDRV